MTIRLPIATRNAISNTMTTQLDAGAGAGLVNVYSGAQPASADIAATGTLLATFTLNDPSFGGSAAGMITLDVSPAVTTTGLAAADAGWFRATDSTGATVMDGSVTVTGGGGDLTMSTITVSVGLTLQLTSGTITTPAS